MATLERLYRDRMLAHRVLFPHKHRNADAPFHEDMLRLFYAPDRWVVVEAFRGAAKSTRMEELLTIGSLFRDFRYGIIIGNSYDRACERLASVKSELETNENVECLFGPQVGGTWATDQIVLANGVKIQAFGARQSLRGAKFNDSRPDFCFVDDLEDDENAATEDARRKLKRWFNGALIPAMDPQLGKIRMAGTPLHPKSLVEEKVKDPAWRSARFPAIYLDSEGQERSAWPDRFPLEYLQTLRQNYMNDGNLTEFEQEYMCRSEDAAAKPFQAGMIKVIPSLAVWTPVQIMVDPARTTNQNTSARTGYAIWSWSGTKLTVHDAFGSFHKPDEIVREIFALNDKYHPVEIGVETNGLEEFLLQPLRAEMLRRGVMIPLSPQRAPRDKDSFIKGLQPFYTAGDVAHAGDFQDLVSELLSFPTGRKDVPNALAYALRMRVGKPVYEDFTMSNIVPAGGDVVRSQAFYLGCSARAGLVAGVLCQYINGQIIVVRDWVLSGPPVERVEDLVREVSLVTGGARVNVVVPAEHFGKYDNFGLVQAFNKVRLRCSSGKSALQAQFCLAPFLRRQVRGVPALMVNDEARWTLNGFMLGYARKVNSAGLLEDRPEDNIYASVMEGLESFASLLDVGDSLSAPNNSETSPVHYATTSDGRKYITSRRGSSR